MWDGLLSNINTTYKARLSAATSAAEREQLEKERVEALATASKAKSKSIAEITKALEQQTNCVPQDSLEALVANIQAMSVEFGMTAPAAAPAAAGR